MGYGFRLIRPGCLAMAVSMLDVAIGPLLRILRLLGLRKVVEQLADEGRLGVCVCVGGTRGKILTSVSCGGAGLTDKAVAIWIVGSTIIAIMAIMTTVQKNCKTILLRKTIASMIPQQL